MISKEITICINPGVDCHSVHVDWLGIEGLIIPCKDKNCITVAVNPDNPTQCLEGFIVCLDANGVQSCKNCEPIYFRKCFCTLDSDCGNCGTCGQDGICKDTCSAIDLAQGKVCYPDGCKCPPNKPILDPKSGKCAECISGSKDPANPCRICIDGKWVTKSCGPDAVCDQSTGDCIDDCSKNTNGKTRWNPITKACDCEAGYRWSTVKNSCVPSGDCKPGFRRNPVTDECEEIKCPNGQIWSIELDKCIEKPCDPTNCEDGLDCTGVNCGCDKTTKKCVSCTDNPNALGCKDSCDGEYCDDTTPCTKPGCTCVGNKCVGCDNFPCDKCGLHEGCSCKDGVNCAGDGGPKDCLDKHELKFEDCSLKTKLTLINPCNCDGIGTSLKVNNFSKAAGTDKNIYKAEFEIDLRKKFINNTTGYELLERFKQSDVTINNDFPDTANCSIEITSYYRDKNGVVFSTPVQILSSEVKTGAVGVKETFVKFENIVIATDKPNDPTLPTVFVGYRLSVYVGDINFVAKSCSYTRTKIYQTSSVGYESISLSTVARYVTIGVVSTTSKRNPILTIKRGTEIIRRLYVTPTSPGLYEDQINGPKKLSFYERGKQEMGLAEGELISLQDYTTYWDCGCDKEKTLKQVSKCDIKEWKNNNQFRIQTSTGSTVCNNQIELLKEHVPCFINQDLEYFGWGANHPSQTKYIISITDKKGVTVVAGTFVYKNTTDTTGYFRKDGTNEQFVGFLYNHTEEITSVSIKMNHDTGCVLSDSISLDLKDAEIKFDCVGANVRATIISRGTLIKKVEIPSLNKVSDTNNSGATQVIIDDIPQNLDVKYIITYINNCKKEQTHKRNCCDSDELVLSVTGIVSKTLTVQTKSRVKLKSILINGTEFISKVTETNNVYVVALALLNDPKTVDVIVTTEANCIYTLNDFDCGESYAIEFDLVPNLICPGETAKAVVSKGPPNTEVIVKSPNGNSLILNLDSNGYGEITSLSIAGDYSIIKVGTSLIADANQFKKSLGVEANPFVGSIELQGGVLPRCSDSEIQFKVIGTLGSIVQLDATKVGFIAKSEVKLNTPVAGSPTDGFGIATFSFTQEGTYTVSATKVQKGRCESIPTKFINVVVTQKANIQSIVSNCIAPLGPTANVKLIVTLSNIGSGAIDVSATTLSTSAVTTLVSTILPNVFEAVISQSQGKTVEISVINGGCVTKQTHVLESCNCTEQTKPPTPTFNNYYVCVPGGSLDIFNNIVGGGQYAVDLYFKDGLTPVKRLTNTNSSYQISSPSQIGRYTPVAVNVATGCTTTGAQFEVFDGNFMLDFDLNTVVNYCSGSKVPMTATVSGGVNIDSMVYKWFVNNVEVIGNTTAQYTHTIQSGPSFTIAVEARRANTVSGTVSSTCIKSVSKQGNVIDCCKPITLTYSTSESSQCGGLTVDAVQQGGSPSIVFNYELYNGLTLITSGSTSPLTPSKIKVVNNLLAFGATSYRLKVYAQGTPLCTHEINFTHNRCACQCRDVIGGYLPGNVCSNQGFYNGPVENIFPIIYTVGTYSAGKHFIFGISGNNSSEFRFARVRFLIDATVLLDTGIMSATSILGCNEIFPTGDCNINNLFLGENINQTLVPPTIPVGTMKVGEASYELCNDLITPRYAEYSLIEFPFNSAQRTVQAQAAGGFTLPTGGVLTLEITNVPSLVYPDRIGVFVQVQCLNN